MDRLLVPVLVSFLAFTTAAGLGCREDNGDKVGRNRASQPKESPAPQATPAVSDTTMVAADDAASARAVIQRAVEAHGGIERLAKLKSQVRSMKGELNFGGAVPATCEVSCELPGKIRWAYELDKGNQKAQITLVLNEDKGWQAGSGAIKEMNKQQVDEVGEELYVLWVTTLVALRDPGFELAALPEITVAEQPAAGVKVARKGRPDLKLYFDKKTGLLAKVERKGTEAGTEITRAYFFSEPKEFDSLKLPTKQVVIDNGTRKVAEWSTISYKFPGSLPGSTFDKP